MGLRMTYNLDSHYSGSYWKIIGWTIDVINRSCTLKVALYKSHSAKGSGAKPVKIFDFEITDTDYVFEEYDDVLATAYDVLKTRSMFATATNYDSDDDYQLPE